MTTLEENWEVPQTEPTQEELMQNIPELANAKNDYIWNSEEKKGYDRKYIYHEGYVYYILIGSSGNNTIISLKRARCDGQKIITLYSVSKYYAFDFNLSIKRISGGYVYFTRYDSDLNDRTLSTSTESTDYKVKLDGSGGHEKVSSTEWSTPFEGNY